MQALDRDIARRLAELGLGFPSLHDSPLRTGFDPDALDRWACEPTRDPQARHAVAFLLCVFSATPGRGLLALRRYLLAGLRQALDQALVELGSEAAPSEVSLAAARVKQAALGHYGSGDRQAAQRELAEAGALTRYFSAARRYLEEDRCVSELELLRWYTRHEVYRVGSLDVIGALAAWDEAHREVFLAWCRAPFFATFLPSEVRTS